MIEHSMLSAGEEVEHHNELVRRSGSGRKRYGEICLRCEAKDDFKAYDLRRRGLRIIEGNGVHRVDVWLARWECRACGLRFTDYPDFRTPI